MLLLKHAKMNIIKDIDTKGTEFGSTELTHKPLVSVIVCTYNRHNELKRALQSVWNQDFKNFELIVVDDGSDQPVEIPEYWKSEFQLFRIQHSGIGTARSVGLEAANGDYVAYCDDDDEWKLNHLSYLLNYLLENPEVDLVYSDSETVCCDVKWVQNSNDYATSTLKYWNYIYASDVLHRSSAAHKVGGFNKSLQAFEDWDLWLRMSRESMILHLPIVLGVRHWQEKSISQKDITQEYSKVHHYHEKWLEEAGECAQHGLIIQNYKTAPFDSSTWIPTCKELVWQSMLRPHIGYGTVARQLILAIEKQGVDITMVPSKDQPPKGFERFYKPLRNHGRIGFYYEWRLKPSVMNFERIISYSMWESTLVPVDHVKEINNRVSLQYVPCLQNLESFKECGVNVPIKVLHHGVDAKQFPFLHREHPNTFTFGSFSDFQPRKGIDVLIRAFQDEFKLGESVRLLLKSTQKPPPYEIIDKRILLISGAFTQPLLLDFLREMDVFVLPSRGEGFGLTGLEAMSTGLPLIATNWSGPAEYLDEADSYPLSYRLVEPLKQKYVSFNGKWAEPDYEHLRYLLRWCFEHPKEVTIRGRASAERVHEHWTWERVAKQLCTDIDEYVSNP